MATEVNETTMLARPTAVLSSLDSGLSMLELILAIAVFSIAASFLAPSVDRYITHHLKEETRVELSVLADAVVRYYRDAGTFPTQLADLSVKPQGITKWEGPYIETVFPSQSQQSDDFRFDQWLETYLTSTVNSFTYRIQSTGENRINESGGGDDLQIDIYVGSVLRDITDQELSELNIAILNYNQVNLPDQPLSSNLETLLTQLQSGGFIASDAATKTKYTYDGWGNLYLPLAAPVQEVVSQGAP